MKVAYGVPDGEWHVMTRSQWQKGDCHGITAHVPITSPGTVAKTLMNAVP